MEYKTTSKRMGSLVKLYDLHTDYFLKAIDEPRADLSESFFVGQSVRANIVDVCEL